MRWFLHMVKWCVKEMCIKSCFLQTGQAQCALLAGNYLNSKPV